MKMNDILSKPRLPPIKSVKRTTPSPDFSKLSKIHESHQNDWKKLEKNIESRYYTLKTNDEANFLREMWAFRESSRSCIEKIDDTSEYRRRKEIAYKNHYEKRLQQLLKSFNQVHQKFSRKPLNKSFIN